MGQIKRQRNRLVQNTYYSCLCYPSFIAHRNLCNIFGWPFFLHLKNLIFCSSGDIVEKVVLCTFVSDTPPPARLDARHEMIQQDMKFCTIINGPCQVAIIYFPLQRVFLLSTRLFLKKYTFVNISRGCLHFKQADVYWMSSGCVDNFWLSIISIICPTLFVYRSPLH